MKLTFKTALILLIAFSLGLSACQGSVAAPSKSVKISTTKPAVPPTDKAVGPSIIEAPATEIVQETDIPSLPEATASVIDAQVAETAPIPVLAQDRRGLIFGAGQMVVAFGDGFVPGEAVAISLIHSEKGVLFNKTANADNLGYLMTAKRLMKNATDKDALPAGAYTFRLTGSAKSQEFRFEVDYSYEWKTQDKKCNYYPQEAVFNGYQVFWCTGLEPGQPYTLTSRLDDKKDQVTNTSDPSGMVVFPLRQSSNTLTPGLWTVSLGLARMESQEPVDTGIPSLSVQILP